MAASASREHNLFGVRVLLQEILRQDAELDALCIDDFPAVFRNFTVGMNRTEKLNQLLLTAQDALPALLAAVRQRHPERYARHRHLLHHGEEPAGPPAMEPGDSIATRLLLGQATPALSCDRSVQWQWIQQSAQRPGHEMLLLPGARGQGHDYFLLRIYSELRQAGRDPRSLQVLYVAWPDGVCPRLKRDGLGALARALGCADQEAAVREALGQTLQYRPLFLLHPCARWPLPSRSRFVTYYCDWLPSLLPAAPYGCKVVQPLEWIASPWPRRALAALLPRLLRRRFDWASQACSAADARALIHRLKLHSQERLPIESLPPLSQITLEHVLEFCDRIRYPADRKARPTFARQLMTGHLASDRILHELAMQLAGAFPAESLLSLQLTQPLPGISRRPMTADTEGPEVWTDC